MLNCAAAVLHGCCRSSARTRNTRRTRCNLHTQFTAGPREPHELHSSSAEMRNKTAMVPNAVRIRRCHSAAVTSTRVQGWGDEPPNGVRCGEEHPNHRMGWGVGRNTRIGGVLLPNEIGLRLSERRATNIGLLYPKVRNNMGWIFPLTSPQTKILGDVSPASPVGFDASAQQQM